ncbi:MAG TPA: dTMP kinase [Thermomicrobiales bacterium]|nr:dTMP kinase [Thermomicrobiales bacterium]
MMDAGDARRRAASERTPFVLRTSYLVVFEGVEGCGKTTQARAAADALRARGVPVTATREPGGTAIGEQVRALLLNVHNHAMLPETEALLLFAARAQHVREVIEPALGRGEVVVCDRFAGATYAYQGYGRGLPLDELRRLQGFAAEALAPDLTILLDLPADAGLARRRVAGEVNRLDAADLAFHRRVREGYRALAAADPATWVVLDAARPVADMTRDVLAVLGARLGLPLAPGEDC